MAASARAAARAIASHRGHFDESVFADDDVDSPGEGGIRLRSSTEAMGRAQERFAMEGQLQEVTTTFDQKAEAIINNEPPEKYSIPWWQWYMVCMTESFVGRMSIICLVIINGIVIGVEADHGDSAVTFFQVTEYLFVIVFTLEVACKLFGFGWLYFTDGWNVTDFIIVLGSLIQVFINAIGDGDGKTPGLSALRLVKILRLVRLIGMMKRLATLAAAFITAMQQVAWVMVLFFIILYIFAVIGSELFNDNATLRASIVNCTSGSRPESYSCHDMRVWSSVLESMLTLFQIMTFDDWAPLYRPIGDELPLAWIYVLIFAPIGSLGLMNLITGVFIEALMDATRLERNKEDDAIRQQRAALIGSCHQTIREFVEACDVDGDGKLGQDEIASVLRQLEGNQDLAHCFEEIGVPISDMQGLINICETEEDGVTINLNQLLNMTHSLSLPTMRHFMFELKHRVYQHEVVEKTTIREIGRAVQTLCDKIADIEKRVEAM